MLITKRLINWFFVGLISLVVVSATLFLPVTIHADAELKQVYFGWPIHFITQDLSGISPPLPWQIQISSFWGNPTQISWFGMLFDLIIVFSVLALLVRVISGRKLNLTNG